MTTTNCVFCKIVRGEVSTHRIFEDDETLAFLDANPLAKGHTLIIPKVHVALLEDLGWEEAKALFKTLYMLVGRVQDAVKASASTIAVNNGAESGQEIPHVHIHIIPRFRNDGGGPIHAIIRDRPHLVRDEMSQITQRIRSLLQKTTP
ncbi:MAG: HIT domain-containing protein [Nitrososphaeria archaeon]|nr:HIT domain-containing protein [Nitrososphaeria archaeon]NIQ33383.1 HIT domain-containing protein [Nitrososphaeria archaeon]